jgi:plastocyanin
VGRRAAGALAVIAAVAALAACGDDDDDREGAGATTGATPTEGQAQAPAGESVATVDVTETDFELDPQNPRIERPGVIEFRISNEGDTVHALEVETPQGEFETEEIPPGEQATLEADLPEGEFVWYCPVGNHREMGMEGTVAVAGGSAGGEPDSGDAGGGGSGY